MAVELVADSSGERAEEPDTKEQEEDREEAATEGNEESLPELLDLIDAAEESAGNVDALAEVIRNIGRRIRATPGDRDLLSDFEGIAHICKALAEPPHSWGGQAMLAFCTTMPDICRTSTVNRGGLRDEGFVGAAVELLRFGVAEGDERVALAASIALSALCTANDGNKKAAARLVEEAPVTDASTEDAGEAGSTTLRPASKPGAIMVLLDALARFEDSVPVQTEAISALRTLITDDDSRRAECTPSAVENREVATGDEAFPFFGMVVLRGLDLADATREGDQKESRSRLRLREQALLLLRELARRQDRVQILAGGAKLLSRVQTNLTSDDSRLVRASLAVLRAFVVIEEIKDDFAMMSDGMEQALAALKKHVSVPAVCEQCFGLFANLTMRKSPIAAKLNDGSEGVVALAIAVLRQHRERPEIMKQTVHTLRNVATQDEAAVTEIKESDIFEEVRKLVKVHEGEARWAGTVDTSRQFLREHRMDEGMLKAAQYNTYY